MIFYSTDNKYTSLTCTSLCLRKVMKSQHVFPYNSLKDKSNVFFFCYGIACYNEIINSELIIS